MKKLTKILLLCALVLCLSGGALLAGGALAGGFDALENIASANLHTYSQDKLPLGTITSLNADLDTTDLTLRPSDDDQAYLDYHLDSTSDSNPLKYSVQDGVLTLNEHQKENYNLTFFGLGPLSDYDINYNPVRTVTLYLPQQQLDNVQIALSVGNCTIDGLNTKAFGMDLNVGDLHLKNTSLSQIDLSLDTGCVDLENTTLNGGSIELSTGDLTGEGLTFTGTNQIELSTGSATIALAPESIDPLFIDATTSLGDVSAPIAWAGNLLATDDLSSHYQRVPQGTTSGTLTINADMGDVTFT